MTKKYMLTDSFHLQKAPITAGSEMCPIPNLPLIGENMIIFSLNLIFGKNLNHGKNLQDLRGQNHCKNVRLVKHLAIYHDFMD